MKVRQRLIKAVAGFQGLMMLTLTVDPSVFKTPWEALQWLRQERAVARLMRELHRRGWITEKWFAVVEFQENGFPHWHVLVESRRVPIEEIEEIWGRFSPSQPLPSECSSHAFSDNYKKAVTRWNDPTRRNGRPILGYVGFSTGFNLANVDPSERHVYAARYVTKYLTKVPEHGFPAWLLALPVESRVRRYSTSRGFWGGTGKPRGEVIGVNKPSGKTYAERVSECGKGSMVVAVVETIDKATGEVLTTRRKLLGWFDVDRVHVKMIDDGGDERRGRRVFAGASWRRVAVEFSRVIGRPVEFTEVKRRHGRRTRGMQDGRADNHRTILRSDGSAPGGDAGGGQGCGGVGVGASLADRVETRNADVPAGGLWELL